MTLRRLILNVAPVESGEYYDNFDVRPNEVVVSIGCGLYIASPSSLLIRFAVHDEQISDFAGASSGENCLMLHQFPLYLNPSYAENGKVFDCRIPLKNAKLGMAIASNGNADYAFVYVVLEVAQVMNPMLQDRKGI